MTSKRTGGSEFELSAIAYCSNFADVDSQAFVFGFPGLGAIAATEDVKNAYSESHRAVA